jgi:hypothetical protein
VAVKKKFIYIEVVIYRLHHVFIISQQAGKYSAKPQASKGH